MIEITVLSFGNVMYILYFSLLEESLEILVLCIWWVANFTVSVGIYIVQCQWQFSFSIVLT